jgi:ABC-type amino acid transport system permease subunit
MVQTIVQFVPVLLAGFLVNLEIGVAVVMIAVAVGVPLSLLNRRVAVTGRWIRPCIGLMQALPTYVVMFFVLTLLPRSLSVFGLPATGMTAVIVAQSVYLTAYVSADAYEALGHLERHDRERALLFLPNLLRGFVVVVMSSGFGAAVGVSEAVSATMRQAERLPTAGDRILLFGVAIAFFAVVVGALNGLIRHLIGRLSR